MPSRRQTNSPRNPTSRLAYHLVTRHVQRCFPEESVRIDLKLPPGLLEEASIPTRTIAVVGAGASAPFLPRAGAAAQQLQRELEPDPRSYERELVRLERVFGLKPKEFETQLLALTRDAEKAARVRVRLAQIYNVRHPIVFQYEILAHLMKHRFLDAIVTFNFDELLDQALLDELGRHEHHKIISERECDSVSFDPDASGYLPIYLKIHGTASDPESLRFTHHDYYSIPDSIAAHVRQLIGRHRCVLLNLGYGFASFDFNLLLDEPTELTIYNVSHSKIEERFRKTISEHRRGRALRIENLLTNERASSRSLFTTGDLVFERVTKDLDNVLRSTETPITFRSIARHRMAAGLLSWARKPEFDPEESSSRYLRDRATIESLLSLIRGRGLMSIASLVNERCIRYYDYYLASIGRGQNPEMRADDSWTALSAGGGLAPSRLSTETFVTAKALRKISRRGEGDLADLRIDLKKAIDHLEDHLCLPTRECLARYGKARLEQDLQALLGETEIEVHARGDSICRKVFVAPRFLPTVASLQGRTLHMLNSVDYNELAVIAETGAWLLSSPYREVLKERIKAGLLRRLYVIVAFSKDSGQLKREFGRGTVAVTQLHWWRHNRHVTLLCKDGSPISGIYFARRQRSLFVTPILVTDEADRQELLRTFLVYWSRASLMPPALDEESLPPALANVEEFSVRLRKRAAEFFRSRG